MDVYSCLPTPLNGEKNSHVFPTPSRPTTFDSFLEKSLYKTLCSAMVRVTFQKLLEVRGWEFKS